MKFNGRIPSLSMPLWSEPSVTAGPGERWCVVALTRPPGAGAGAQAGSGCRRAPEETVVLGDFFVCLLNYLLEWI